MKISSIFNLFVGLLFLFIFSNCNDKQGISNDKGSISEDKKHITSQIQFELLNPQHTGVKFINRMIESQGFNYMFWERMYNGAGVATGDFNNDGLVDLFITANIMGNRLYLNKGNMQFEDITNSAGFKPNGLWSFGVTLGDVNGDGYLDIYVCRNSHKSDEKYRMNSLYINHGDMTFSDEAVKYGVADIGFSKQASFFDMDNDGDLDLFVGNQPPDKRIINKPEFKKQQGPKYVSDHLYRNDGNGHFTNVTKSAGVESFSYTLNVITSDINNDGWVDVFLTNEYEKPDFLYINNGDGTFTDDLQNRMKHITNFSMGSDINDINNDGLMDIGVLDMVSSDHYRSKTNMRAMNTEEFWKSIEQGNYYQFMSNTLQLNTGLGTFSEIAQYAHINATDWSWSLLMADFDNDAYKDIFISNGYYRDVRNNDFTEIGRLLNEKGIIKFDPIALLNSIPSTPVANYLFHNLKNATFKNIAADCGLTKKGFSNGAAYADLDNDGDLDLIINNLNDTLSIYKNITKSDNHWLRVQLKGSNQNTKALNAKIIIKIGDEIQIQEILQTRGYLSCTEPIAHFGLGNHTVVDEMKIIWPNQTQTILKDIKTDQLLDIDQATVKTTPITDDNNQTPLFKDITEDVHLNYQHQENDYNDFDREILLPHKLSSNGPYMSKGDVNNDGLEDFFIGGAKGFEGKLFLQLENNKFVLSKNQPWNQHKGMEDNGSLLFDVDGDNDLDMYIVSGGSEFQIGSEAYQDRLYINDGTGQFSYHSTALPKINQSGSIVKASDIDGDGDLDLFVGGRLQAGYYPHPAKSYILINENGTFSDKTDEMAPSLNHLGMVTDAIFVDINKDGSEDIVAVGEWMPITILISNNGKFKDETSTYNLGKSNGWWWSINSADFNGDGYPDFVVGNQGKNHKYKASKKKPLTILGGDFDENGTNDVVLAKYYKGDLVPVRGRECSSEQMPFIKDKFPTYDSFARATINTIYPEEKIKNALRYEITDFSSILLMSEDDGTYHIQKLPYQSQFSPTRTTLIKDWDNNGSIDVIGCGNFYDAEVETIRHDAGIGYYLSLDNNKIIYYNPRESGLLLDDDERSMILLDDKTLVVASNKGKLKFYQFVEKNNM